jgi:hypothetical protein
MTAPSREQKPFYNRFMRLVNDDHFADDINLLRSSTVDITQPTYENFEEFEDGSANADEIPSPLLKFMIKYDLPPVMEDFISLYILKDKVDLTMLRSGVYIVDHGQQEASGSSLDKHLNYQSYAQDTMHDDYVELTLAIPIHALSTQIADTLAQHKQFIKDKQAILNGGDSIKRIKLYPKDLRNREILRLHQEGLKPSEILLELPDTFRGELTAPDISKIIYKLRSKH